jgi:hypothetical protein
MKKPSKPQKIKIRSGFRPLNMGGGKRPAISKPKSASASGPRFESGPSAAGRPVQRKSGGRKMY